MVLDRRQHLRQTVHSEVYVDLFLNTGGWLSNISEGGLALDLFFPAVPGQGLRLGFSLPGTCHRIEANCEIAWTGQFGRKAGLRFLDLTEASRQQIRKWLSARTPSPRSGLVGLFVGAAALCGLTLVFVCLLAQGWSCSGQG
jgi:hypothetical protein